MNKIGANFLFCLSSRAMLPFNDQMFPSGTRVNLRSCFWLMGQQGTM